MRQAFVHDAVVVIEDDGDDAALGAAVTVALCGHWEHDPPCPLAAHYTGVERSGAEARLRVLFASEPGDEIEVRARIEAALLPGQLQGPDGVTTRWEFLGARSGSIRDDESAHAQRLAHSS